MATAKKRAPRARPQPVPAAALDAVFAALKGLLAKHAYHLNVVHDLPDHYYLETRKPGPDGKPVFFGAVQRRKGYVAYHLMPLATDAALALKPFGDYAYLLFCAGLLNASVFAARVWSKFACGIRQEAC